MSHKKVGLIILLAVIVRLAFVVAVDTGKLRVEHNPDAEDYLSFAYNLATGVGFAHAIHEDQPFSQPVEFSAWRTPLYPMFLSVAFHVSRNTFFLQSLQVALVTLSLYFFLRLGLLLFGELPALIAGLVFALYPPLIYYTAELTTESLFLFLLSAVLFVFYQGGKEPSALRCFSLGVLTGLAALCRPNGLMLVPAIGLAMWLTMRSRGQALRRVIVLGLAVAMVVLPWTYRNYRLYHKFVLISTNGGNNLWFGAHFRLDNAPMAEFAYSQHQAFRDVPEPEREKYYYRQAFAILDHSPRRWGEMFALNFAAMYTLMPSAKLHSFTGRILYSICYVPILFSGIAGWILLRPRWRELTLLWGWVAADTFLYCIYVSSIRYRVASVDPILLLGTGVFVAAIMGQSRHPAAELESSPTA
jgi:4-amino-4-deoxy-L-arabinose transferase-like glycosyltransferase